LTGWAKKRFWAQATVAQAAGGWQVLLDGRAVKTPAKAPLMLPNAALAQAIAAEWQAQGGDIAPATMPFTKMANTAIDGTAPRHAAVVDSLAAWGGSDLLCYRAERPALLAARQAAEWDPWLDWAADALGARLRVTRGVMPVPQPPQALAALRAAVAGHDPFRLTALHDLVTIPGSLVLGLAVARGALTPDRAFDLSRIDDDWQADQWGADEEAAESAARRRAAMAAAGRFCALCG
jgi:chaperone required for assembly of F1-ATPase